MTRKHYIAIAKIIKDNSVPIDDYQEVLSSIAINKYNLVNDLCDMMYKDNNLFNRARFKKACQ